MPIGGALCPFPKRLGGNAEDGWSPEQHARLCADLVAVKRVTPLASWRYTQTGATAVTLHDYTGQNGRGLLYAPTATGNADGDVSFAWPAQYFEDEYGVQHYFKVRAAIVTLSAQAGGGVWEVIARGVRVRLATTGGAATNTPAHVTVW